VHQFGIINIVIDRCFEESSDTNFHENPSSGSRAVPCGRTDMTKFVVAFRNFSNPPYKNKRAKDGALYCATNRTT